MEALQRHLIALEKYVDYTFSTGVYTGNDYKLFQNKYKRYLTSLCEKNGWELVNFSRNHYCFSTFIKVGDRYVYLSISDVRYWQNEWYTHLLVRSAKSPKDYTGGMNHYSHLLYLEGSVIYLSRVAS